MKKACFLLLALCMMLSLMPAAAFAADSGSVPGTYYKTVWDEATNTVTASDEPLPSDGSRRSLRAALSRIV